MEGGGAGCVGCVGPARSFDRYPAQTDQWEQGHRGMQTRGQMNGAGGGGGGESLFFFYPPINSVPFASLISFRL